MMHLRVVCSQDLEDRVVDTLRSRTGVVAVVRSDLSSHGRVVTADVAREIADEVLRDLHDLGVYREGMIALNPIDAAFGALAERAEKDAPGEADDAVIWDELTERIDEDATLTWTFVGFMVLATLLAGIGVVTDSSIAIVGAMVVGPEFGPLAGLAIALVRRRANLARLSATALLVGFATAIIVVGLLSALGQAGGLIHADALNGPRETAFIYHPGWFSLITALVAGLAGMLSIMSSRSAALVGVFISVTTIPAAGNAAVAGVLGKWHEAGLSLLQLAINLVGITVAATSLLALRGVFARRRVA
jgi:uncharacterized hydrophobic protein (TIGR00271 family)